MGREEESKKVEGEESQSDDLISEEDGKEEEEIRTRVEYPGLDDPKMFSVRVKGGCEKVTAIRLMNKYIWE